MAYNLRLRLGFFRTERYSLEVFLKQLVLIPAANGDMIVLGDKDIESIIIFNRKLETMEFEINAVGGLYMGILEEAVDISELMGLLKEQFGNRVLLDYR